MDANTPPIDFRFEHARRCLDGLIAAGEGLSLGSLAADLDLTPPETLGLLHQVVVRDNLPVRAELDLHCPQCEQPLELVMGLAAWVLAALTFKVPCACGRTVTIEPSFLELLLKPDTVVPLEADVPAARYRVAETTRSRGKSLDREALSAMQLSFDWDLNPADGHPEA